MSLSILVGLVAFFWLLVLCFVVEPKPEPIPKYLTICGDEWPGVGTCQRNGGHGGAHSFVGYPKNGDRNVTVDAQWKP